MKKVIVPPMLVDLVTNALQSLEGVMFTDLETCPYCGGELKGHDLRKKRFATILDGEKKKEIFVFVKRFHCSHCGRLCYADAPFYPETRLGSPVVDLCVVNLADHPYNHLAQLLKAMNIIIDRGTIRNYANRKFDPVPVIEVYGFKLPISLLAISDVTFRSERGPVIGTELLRSIRLPTTDRALLHMMGAFHKGNQGYKKKEKEERQSR